VDDIDRRPAVLLRDRNRHAGLQFVRQLLRLELWVELWVELRLGLLQPVELLGPIRQLLPPIGQLLPPVELLPIELLRSRTDLRCSLRADVRCSGFLRSDLRRSGCELLRSQELLQAEVLQSEMLQAEVLQV
jgi:hypothetical protein